MDVSQPIVRGRCAAHPDVVAEGTCARCGDFYCKACAQYTNSGRVLCARCPAPASLAQATRGTRFAAQFLDGIIVALAMGGVALILRAMPLTADSGLAVTTLVSLIAPGIAGLIQLIVMAADPWRRSIGKRITGIRVARPDGRVPELWRIIFLRNVIFSVAGLTPVVGPFVSLADILFIFGESRRCIHDYAADTIVVEIEPGATPAR